MIKKHPEEALGPFIDWREHSLLNNSRFPAEDKARAVQVYVCQVSLSLQQNFNCASNSSAPSTNQLLQLGYNLEWCTQVVAQLHS